ncbi:magnesium protoporphyrin IX methyltransferase [Halomonas denitrificans]|nr:magnesium protoporphyrin IX methyltransferase [Halomonas denitrificans]
MSTTSYQAKRSQLLTYFDRTAVDAWRRLTSDEEVGRIRASVRAGRDEMRRTLLAWLPEDLSGQRVLDAGCGTGATAVELARRGADVLAVDIAPKLVELAADRAPDDLPGTIDFRVGDLLDPALGRFDAVIAMDSLIHYQPDDCVRVLGDLGRRVDGSILFTFAPRTVLLSMMHAAGKLFPRGNRAPMIEPVRHRRLCAMIERNPGLRDWSIARTRRVHSAFYISQAMELRR